MTEEMKQNAYKEAGVDVDAAADLVERIKPLAEKTKRTGVADKLGGFGAVFDLKETGFQDPVLVSSTDGVGTKLKLAIALDRHDTVGIDAVAMCVNDLIVQGAEPLYFLDYFATGKLVPDTAERVIVGLAEGCAMAGCALIGGETAEMPGMYAPGDYDVAGFAVGAVERDSLITGRSIAEGDVILGLASNGLHSNGFSLIRKILDSNQGLNLNMPCSFAAELSLGEMLLTPTRIYVRAILDALKIEEGGQPAIKGMAHITGGGIFENIPRVLPDNMAAEISFENWPLTPLYRWLREQGKLSHHDMLGTLNCGVGYIIICKPDHAGAITETLEKHNETVMPIGRIVPRDSEDVIIKDVEPAWGSE